MAKTKSNQGRVSQRDHGTERRAVAAQPQRDRDWAAKAPRPDLLPGRMEHATAQTKRMDSWAGKAPRPDLLPTGTQATAQAKSASRIDRSDVPRPQMMPARMRGPAAQAKAGAGAVAQALFWEYTPEGNYVWHWGPVIHSWWRQKMGGLMHDYQEMKDGYGVWLRKSAWVDRSTSPTVREVRVEKKRRKPAVLVGEKQVSKLLDYGNSVFPGGFTSCVMVIFQMDDGFVCWHAKSAAGRSIPRVMGVVSAIDMVLDDTYGGGYDSGQAEYDEIAGALYDAHRCVVRIHGYPGTPSITVTESGIDCRIQMRLCAKLP
ncbi:MAG: hypothetical protein K0V04_01670 [Deltaproteobacteria bacterium]|nr:hypothetical protein [Deltaproteobacteria bacterium]